VAKRIAAHLIQPLLQCCRVRHIPQACAGGARGRHELQWRNVSRSLARSSAASIAPLIALTRATKQTNGRDRVVKGLSHLNHPEAGLYSPGGT
jgi:hypothetical protein